MNQVKSNGASSTLFQHDRPNRPNRSKFDLSRINNFSLDPGMIVPIDCIPTLPGDDFRISIKMALDTLPLIQSSLTNYKILTHWYYIKNRDLWKGWKTFITKGRTGNVNLTVPTVDLNVPLNSSTLSFPIDNTTGTEDTSEKPDSSINMSGNIYPISKHSLASYLGVPPFLDGIFAFVEPQDNVYKGYLQKDYLPYTFRLISNAQSASVLAYEDLVKTGFGNFSTPSALPFMAYQNIVKNNYVNQNLLQENRYLFPEEGDDDWLIPYNASKTNFVGQSSTSRDFSDGNRYDGVFTVDDTSVDLRLLRYAQFDDDYFTTGLPWLERGDVTTLDLYGMASGNANTNTVLSMINSTGNTADVTGNIGTPGNDAYAIWHQDSDSSTRYYASLNNTNDFSGQQVVLKGAQANLNHIASLLKATSTTTLSNLRFSGDFTANQLRELIAMSVWQERNARTDGSYNRTIFEHWNLNPKSEEHKPVYIGGTCDYLNFSTVIQNSETTSSSRLGDTAGFGSASGSGDVGTFHCDDYGFIMGVMIIKPNTTYQQGVEHYLFETSFEDYVQPEFEGLSPQSILNKELFVQGNSDDDDLFAYQERYTYLKVRQNVNRGLFQTKPDKDILFGAFTQARWFENKPELSYQFLCMSPDNIRRDWLAYPVYPTFRCQLLSNVFATRSLAYTSQPNTFGF